MCFRLENGFLMYPREVCLGQSASDALKEE